jgi:hypothetical protein
MPTQLEKDSTERIADLTLQVQDLEAALEKLKRKSDAAMDDDQVCCVCCRVDVEEEERDT